MQLIVIEHGCDFSLCKADHRIEATIDTDISADVKATGYIIHRHRRDARDKEPGETGNLPAGGAFEQIKEIAEEATAVGQVVIGLLAVRGEDGVGKVVILVNQ